MGIALGHARDREQGAHLAAVVGQMPTDRCRHAVGMTLTQGVVGAELQFAAEVAEPDVAGSIVEAEHGSRRSAASATVNTHRRES